MYRDLHFKKFPFYLRVLELWPTDWKAAFETLQKGAATDHYCMWMMGECYNIGFWVKYDWDIAKKWYEDAARLGNARAAASLCYRYKCVCTGPTTVHDEYAVGLYMESCNNGRPHYEHPMVTYVRAFKATGEPWAAFKISYLSDTAGRATDYCRIAAELGHPMAQDNYATMLRRLGRVREAIDLYKKAVDQGYTHSIHHLTNIYLHDPTLKNNIKALSWHKKTEIWKSGVYGHKNQKHFDNIELYQSGIFTILMIWQFRQSILGKLPRGVIMQIIKYIQSQYMYIDVFE